MKVGRGAVVPALKPPKMPKAPALPKAVKVKKGKGFVPNKFGPPIGRM
jgi:hypothetical protein